MSTLTEVFTNIANSIRKQSNINSDVKIKGEGLSNAIDDIDYRIKLKFNKDPEKNTKVDIYYDYYTNNRLDYFYKYPDSLIEESDDTISLKLDNEQLANIKFGLNTETDEYKNTSISNITVWVVANIDNCIIEEKFIIPYIGSDHFKLGNRNLYLYKPEIAPFIDNVNQPLIGKNSNYAIAAGGIHYSNNAYNFSSTVNLYNKNTLTLTQGQDLSEGKAAGSISSTDQYTLLVGSKVDPNNTKYSIPSNIIDVYNSSMTRSTLTNTNISTSNKYISSSFGSPSLISCTINNNIVIANYMNGYESFNLLSYYNNNLTQGNISISNNGYYSCINSLNRALFINYSTSENYNLDIFNDNLVYSNISIPLNPLENISSYVEMCGNDGLLAICKRLGNSTKWMFYNSNLTSYQSEPYKNYTVYEYSGYKPITFLINNKICAFTGDYIAPDRTLNIYEFYEYTSSSSTNITYKKALNNFRHMYISNTSYDNKLLYISLGKITLFLDNTSSSSGSSKLIALKWIDND